MKLKDKRNETLEVRVSPLQSHAKDTSANHAPSREETRLRAYESTLTVAASQAMSWMIGWKPNANSSVQSRYVSEVP